MKVHRLFQVSHVWECEVPLLSPPDLCKASHRDRNRFLLMQHTHVKNVPSLPSLPLPLPAHHAPVLVPVPTLGMGMDSFCSCTAGPGRPSLARRKNGMELNMKTRLRLRVTVKLSTDNKKESNARQHVRGKCLHSSQVRLAQTWSAKGKPLMSSESTFTKANPI